MSERCFLCGKRFFAVLAVLALLLSLFGAGKAAAAEEQPAQGSQVVKVGWYQSDMFQEGASDAERKSGYCYDYLQKVSDYTKWTYEYVYGDWTELFHKLETGEIDFLAGVSETDERKQTMLFPKNAMGTDQYYLYKHADDTSISAEDMSTLTGKKVGGITDNRATTFLQQWIEENNVDLEIVYYDSFEAQEADFESGKLDLMAQTINNVLTMDGITILAKVGEEPFYLAVSKERTDLLSELNAALTTMLSIDPFILQDLQYQNYGATLTSRTLTAEENQWIAAHPTIYIGYLDNYLPYCDTDSTGQTTGLMTDVLSEIIAELGLQDSLSVQYIEYSNYNEMIEALKDGAINAAFPVYGDLWNLEETGIDATSAVVSGTETFFYKGTFQGDTAGTIAVNRNNDMQIAFCRRNLPDAELVEYDSIDACLDAVVNGEADGTVINSLRTELVTGDPHYKSLSYVQLSAEELRCFGINADGTELLEILNRGIRILGTSYGLDNSYKYMSSFYEYDVSDFLRDHAVVLGLTFAVVAGLIISFLIYSLRRIKKTVREKETSIRRVQELNTELEERQTQLEKAKTEAEAADRAKTAFLFNMSHDIRTPMNAIIGYTDLVEKYYGDKDRCMDYLHKTREANRFLLSLINNVLEMARIESGKSELVEEACSLRKVMRDISSIFEDQMRGKDLTFTRNVDIHTEYVYCDASKLSEIYLNLLSNAFKYTMPGGSVTSELTELPSDRPGYALFRSRVSDTGIGMSAEFLPHIFEEFSRERSSTESRQEGTGLGMPIVKKLVEQMDGTVEVESELGKGSVFTVKLYLRIAEAAAEKTEESPAATPAEFGGKRILLAEDNDLNAEIAAEILAEFGFETERAEDGAVCVEMLRRADAGYYALILMDVQMPNMDGYTAARTIRALPDPEKANIPIIAMTANAFEEDKKNALDAGMNGHLGKPIDVQKLMETLSAAVK